MDQWGAFTIPVLRYMTTYGLSRRATGDGLGRAAREGGEKPPRHIQGGGFDLPAVEPIFSRYVAAHGLRTGCVLSPAIFSTTICQRRCLIMGLILHDWDLPSKRMLIGKAHAALEKGGSLIVYEFLIDDRAGLTWQGC